MEILPFVKAWSRTACPARGEQYAEFLPNSTHESAHTSRIRSKDEQ